MAFFILNSFSGMYIAPISVLNNMFKKKKTVQINQHVFRERDLCANFIIDQFTEVK